MALRCMGGGVCPCAGCMGLASRAFMSSAVRSSFCYCTMLALFLLALRHARQGIWAAACAGQLRLACLKGMQGGHLLPKQRQLSADQLLLCMRPGFSQLLQLCCHQLDLLL